jgi:hypothetical protein
MNGCAAFANAMNKQSVVAMISVFNWKHYSSRAFSDDNSKVDIALLIL